ncbi:MAG: FAD/NAD(P)-binding oxidoreductase [Chitinophagales bacterium]
MAAKNILILGAGSAGTMMANHLKHKLHADEWNISIVDEAVTHYYQPGFLFLPFGIYDEQEIQKPIQKFIPHGITYINKEIDKVVPEENKVILKDTTILPYDILIIATGCNIAPEEVEGMQAELWHKDIFDFYSFEGAKALHDKLEFWEGGKMVIHITEMPIKCPVAPLEFAFLADDFFKHKGMREEVEITYVTPLSGAFTKPFAAKKLGHLIEEKGIKLVTDFYVERIDNKNKQLLDYGGQVVDFDLLVTVPLNKGAACIGRSGFGDDLNYVPTNKHTLQTTVKDNIFAIGDATALPASKAGSVAHFESEILTENILHYIHGEALKAHFDGHANCFVETGNHKALLIDFNYEQEPVEGTFPFAGVGPMSLMEESMLNHMGKLGFKWIYWNVLMRGRTIPFIHPNMQKAGKKIPHEAE